MADFDPYHKWLGIRPEDQPPHHYRLLGISAFEADPDVIDTAAEQRLSYLKTCATGEHVAESQRLLNEVTSARLVLLNAEKKKAYDAALKAAQPSEPAVAAPAGRPTRTAPRSSDAVPVLKSNAAAPQSAPATPAGTATAPPPATSAAPAAPPLVVADEPRLTPFPPTKSRSARKGKDKDRRKGNRDAPLVLAIGGSLLGILGLVGGVWFFAFRTPDATVGAVQSGANEPPAKTVAIDGTRWPGGVDPSKKSSDGPAPTGTPGPTSTTPIGTNGPTGTTPVFEPPPPVTPAARVAAGPTLELLRIVDVKQDALRGSFAKVDGRIECVVPGNYRTLELPVLPRGDYVLRVKAARLAGEEGFQLYLPVGERSVRVLLDGMHLNDPRGYSGLESIDGRRVNSNATAVRDFHFEQGRTHEIVAEVATSSGSGSVVVKVDERELLRWSGPVAALSVAPEPLRRSDALGRRVDNKVSYARIESVRLTMRTGEALFLRPMTPDTIVQPGSDTTPNPVATTNPTTGTTTGTNPNPTTGTTPKTPLPPLGPFVGNLAPVPTDAHLEYGEEKVKEIYGADYAAAKKAGEKRTLARRLLTQTGRFAATDELPVLYVVLRDARNLASAGGDANTVVAACDSLAKRFQVARIPLIAEGLQQAVRAATASEDIEALAVAAMAAVDQAVVHEEFEAADKLHAVAAGAVQKVRIPALAARLQPLKSRVQEARTENLRYRNALAAVEKSATDVAAWKTIGIYLCLWRSDWTKGIDALARTGNTDLVFIAEQEKSRPAQAADQVRLADAWWDWIERQSGKTAHPFRAAAEFWYRTARPTASPNDRSKIDKRLEEIGHPEILREVPYGAQVAAVGRFLPVFNGRNLEGWQIRAGAPADWAVADGLLKSAARNSGWLGTHRTYRDFVFRGEYRMKGNGDSGILLRKAADGTGGLQIQIIDDRKTDLFGIPVEPTGTLLGFRRARRSAVHPIGEWNLLEIRCQGRRIVVHLNRELLVDVSISPTHPDYGDEGTLGVEHFNSPLEFRNLQVLEFLPPHPEVADPASLAPR